MRRAVKVLANFLGAVKELTGEYADLAEIRTRSARRGPTTKRR